MEDEDWPLTVRINIGHYQTTNLDLTPDDIDWLYGQGLKSVDSWIKKYLL